MMTYEDTGTSVKCGNCKGTHATADMVRYCYQQARGQESSPLGEQPVQVDNERHVTTLTLISWAKEQRWSNFAQDVAARYDRFGKLSTRQREVLQDMYLKAQNEGDKPAQRKAIPDVPAGYYALPETEGHEVRYFRVDRPTEGRYAGWTFLREQAGDEFHKVNFGRTVTLLGAIVEYGTEQAQVLYGTTIGRCYACNRTLTDDLSRELGIGPVCRSK